MFDTSPVISMWLEMSMGWHTKSQGPKKKCIHFAKRRIDPCPAHTARNYGSFTPYALWSVKSFNSPTVCTYILFKIQLNRRYRRYNIFCGTTCFIYFVKHQPNKGKVSPKYKKICSTLPKTIYVPISRMCKKRSWLSIYLFIAPYCIGWSLRGQPVQLCEWPPW